MKPGRAWLPLRQRWCGSRLPSPLEAATVFARGLPGSLTQGWAGAPGACAVNPFLHCRALTARARGAGSPRGPSSTAAFAAVLFYAILSLT